MIATAKFSARAKKSISLTLRAKGPQLGNKGEGGKGKGREGEKIGVSRWRQPPDAAAGLRRVAGTNFPTFRSSPFRSPPYYQSHHWGYPQCPAART